PGLAKAWDNRGYVLMQLGRDRDALKSFDKAIAANANYAKSYYNRALCYALQRENDRALENLQQAVRLEPSYKQDALADEIFEDIWSDDWFKELVGQ
ncbi:MAG: tetratricopeptide repeat protein, partial [Cyanobacteria bacterium J06607_10]